MRARFARLRDDLLGLGDRFLLLALGDVRRAFARFVDHLLRGGVRLGRISCIALLRLGELLLDLLGVQQAFGDPLPAFFEHAEDRLVGETAAAANATIVKLMTCERNSQRLKPNVRRGLTRDFAEAALSED